MFTDISYHANRYVPTAVPIPAEAFVRAMHRLREIGWFSNKGKNGQESEQFDVQIQTYDGTQ